MKFNFENRLEAIEWIAQYADDEGQFEVLREQLIMNMIQTGQLFIDLDKEIGEVILLNDRIK